MHRGSHSQKSSGSGNGGSGLLNSLKKITNVSSSSSSSESGRNTNVSSETKPLSKRATLNTQSLSQYMKADKQPSVQTSPSVASVNAHSRSPSLQSSTKYTYSRRSSASNNAHSSGMPNPRLSRQQSNLTSSTASILSQGSYTNLSKFIAPDGSVRLDMPQDPMEVETLFEDIMYKRNIFQSLSPQKQRELMDYDVNKKWLIVKQDLQNELKKNRSKTGSSSILRSDAKDLGSSAVSITSHRQNQMDNIHQHSFSNPSNLNKNLPPTHNTNMKHKKSVNGMNNVQGKEYAMKNHSTSVSDRTDLPPTHYVKKILADKLTVREMNDLWVTLRTEQLDWVDAFLDHQGHIAMANILLKSLYRTGSMSINNEQLPKELVEKEASFFKCFRVLIMLSQGLFEFTRHRLMSETIAYGLFSSRLSTRRMATEIFVIMLEKKNKPRFEAILNALDKNFKLGENLNMVYLFKTYPERFTHSTAESQFKVIQAWLYAVDQSLNGRGKMGSMVGASEEYKASGGENAILEYTQWTMMFINQLCSHSDILNQRVLLRTKLENLGILRIMGRIKLLDYEKVETQLQLYENNKLDDFNTVLEMENKKQDVDMQNPLSLIQHLSEACKGTENEKLLTSLVQHLFISSSKLISERKDQTKLSKQLKLLDSLVTNITVSSVDEESNINMAIQRLYDSMQTDEVARRAILESRILTKKLEETQAERDYLTERLNNAQNGLVGQLQKEIAERDNILAKTQRVTQQLQEELEELKKKSLLEKHEHEVELRKMLTILNSKPDNELHNSIHSNGKASGLIDSDRKLDIQQVLQDGLKKAKKDLSADSKRFGITVQPNKRLKILRMQMEDIENEARQLEMTNFAEYEKKKLKGPVNLKPPKKASIAKDIKANKLAELRQALTEIQTETNSISKFNVEERFNELFNEKKLKALERLKELEAKYKGFGIDFDLNEIIEEKENIPSPNQVTYSSLDPKSAQAEIDEITRLTQKLELMKDQLEKQQSVNDDTTDTTVSSDEADSLNGTERDANNQKDTGANSFLESLSQKYGTGQKGSPTSPIAISPGSRTASVIEKSLMNRMRRNTSSAPYLEELTKRMTSISSDSSPSFEEEVTQEQIQDYAVDQETSNEGKLGVLTERASPPPPPPPLPGILKGESSQDSCEQQAAAPLPPPPPPPLPSSSVFGGSTPALAPPPPPLPPNLSPTLSSPKSASPPPAPPMMSEKALYRNAVSSPLLSETPSVFEKYPRPQKKLKQLHWEKLESADGSVWGSGKAEKIADDLYEKGVLSELEKAFAAREIKSLATKRREDLDKITFLSRDVSQQFGINLHMYGSLQVDEVVRKILHCDKDFLQAPNVIEFLSKPEIIEVTVNLARSYAPYSTDWEGVNSVEDAKPPEKDPGELQRADQIYLQLMVNLQSYWGSRMRALRVITSYEKEYTELVTKLRKVDKAVSAIEHSDNLQNVFNVILAVGNYMNDTSKQAQGFKLATLQRLTFIKDATNSMTFLNYVEKIVRKNYPSFNDFLKELEPVLDVVKISVEQLVYDCNEFIQSISNVERSLGIGNLSDTEKFHPLDRVLVKVHPVLPEASKKGELLGDEVKLTVLEFERLMQKYGEDSGDKFAQNSFFKKFADFISEYKKAQTQNIKAEEEELVYERHKKMVEEQQRKAQEEHERISAANESEVDEANEDAKDRRAVMDKLLEQLKNAGPGKSDPSSARKRAMIRKKLSSDKDAETQLVHEFDNGDDSIIYSPSTEHKTVHLQSPSFSDGSDYVDAQDRSSPPKDQSHAEGSDDGEEIGERAKALLLELRGSGTPSKRNTALSERKERIRARRNKAFSESTSSNKLQFVSDPADNDATTAETSSATEQKTTQNEQQQQEEEDDDKEASSERQ